MIISRYAQQFHQAIRRYGTSALRDRLQFLISLSVAMKCDSEKKTDMCDLCDFIFHQPGEHDPYHVLT